MASLRTKKVISAALGVVLLVGLIALVSGCAWKSELDAEKAKVAKLEKDNAALKSQVDTLTKEKDALTKEVEGLKAEIAKLKAPPKPPAKPPVKPPAKPPAAPPKK